MSLNRNSLYFLLVSSCLAGYIWLLIESRIFNTSDNQIEVCLIKQITNIPCPSCGATRSVLSLFKGNFSAALYWNPLGYIIALIMIASPIWIIYDYLMKKESLFNFYRKIESFFQQKKIAILAIILIISNWIWNIYKDL